MSRWRGVRGSTFRRSSSPGGKTRTPPIPICCTIRVEGPDGRLVPAVDFLGTADTPYPWELNIWYHTLNCGFRTRIAGETDFPCIYGQRVGMGRSYVKVAGTLTYAKWCEGIKQGRAYVGDGRSHLIDFAIGDVRLGEGGSVLRLSAPQDVDARARVATFLPEKSDSTLGRLAATEKPYWHLERARNFASRSVDVELIINGSSVQRRTVAADGEFRDLIFSAAIERSSWVAVRILPSAHTNPIFVLVDDKPIRASRRSARWCLDGVDTCWTQKQRFIAGEERPDAVKAYEHARRAYRVILSECEVD